MAKKFLEGLVFGLGFSIAFVVIWIIAAELLTSRMISSLATSSYTPKFDNPKTAQVVEAPLPGASNSNRDFSFFKHIREELKVPQGGGILAMSPVSTQSEFKRPSTYQLWLTGSQLWQIRTTEEKVETEELPYPTNADVTELDRLIREKVGLMAQQSTMTISADDIERLKASGDSHRDDSMNGKLKVTTEGIVFVLPNPYER